MRFPFAAWLALLAAPMAFAHTAPPHAANRIRDLDRRRVEWKIMKEIDFVNIGYKPSDASTQDVAPSGLLGPVTLTPLG